MSYSETLTRPISLQASEYILWDRTPQDRQKLLRSDSMLPQFKIPSDILSSLSKNSNRGVITAFKYSPNHSLSLKATSIYSLVSGQPSPPADFLLYILDPFSKPDFRMFQKMLSSITRRLDREIIDPLDLFKVSLSLKGSQLTSHILHPLIDLQFTPLASLKLVSSPLVMKLTKTASDNFQSGYLTLDQSGRAVPLLSTDPMVFQYPLVGIWVSGIPDFSLSKETPLIHPNVWAACVQFLLNSTQKISPCRATCTFLCLHFSRKFNFYQVSSQGDPIWVWQTVRTEHVKGSACLLQFSKEASISSSDGSVCKTPSRVSGSSSVFHSYDGPQSAQQIIQEQSRMIEEMRNQIQVLQAHIGPQITKTYSQGSLTTPLKREPSVGSSEEFSMQFSGFEIDNRSQKTLKPSSEQKRYFCSFFESEEFLRSSQFRDTQEFTKLQVETPDRSKTPKQIQKIKNLKRFSPGLVEKSVERQVQRKDLELRTPKPSEMKIGLEVREDKPANEQTFCVPHILYKSDSSDEDDEEIQILENKYLKYTNR